MALLGYVGLAFLVSVVISLAVGGGWRRQYLLALACPASLAALIVVALIRGCPPNAQECSPEFTLFLGAFLGLCITVGWVAGVGAAALIRRVRQSRSGSSASQGVR